ncbi:FecR family protein [Belliella marina]|uniref:FecR family protein n=1 Tax=Belliella marina TaxID=1644146 RepID=A0ABW4VN87_9BACT
MMTDKYFYNLLEKSEKGTCTREEQELLERWLDDLSLNSQSAFKDERDKENLKVKMQHAVYKEIGISRKEAKIRKLHIPPVWKVAASIAILALVGYFGYGTYEHYVEKPYAITQSISGEEINKILLSDGSIIWLKPGSSLEYHGKFRKKGIREVTLHGEALFEIEKDPSRPFIVNSGEITTTVLGTSFNIKASGDLTQVVVLTGKVKVTANQTKKELELLPNETAVYAHTDQLLSRIEDKELETPVESLIAGTEYDMDFDNITVNELVQRIAGKFNIQVSVEGSVGKCLITADFTGQSLRNTLEMVTEVLNAEFTIDDKKVTLKGEGCG